MANPTQLKWDAPTQNTDGSVFNQSQYQDFELEIDGTPAVAVPAAWQTSGHYTLPFSDIAALSAYGSHTLRLRVVNKAGTASAYTPPVTYVFADLRVPNSPLALSVV